MNEYVISKLTCNQFTSIFYRSELMHLFSFRFCSNFLIYVRKVLTTLNVLLSIDDVSFEILTIAIVAAKGKAYN